MALAISLPPKSVVTLPLLPNGGGMLPCAETLKDKKSSNEKRKKNFFISVL
jgi:hypothetical protein